MGSFGGLVVRFSAIGKSCLRIVLFRGTAITWEYRAGHELPPPFHICTDTAESPRFIGTDKALAAVLGTSQLKPQSSGLPTETEPLEANAGN